MLSACGLWKKPVWNVIRCAHQLQDKIKNSSAISGDNFLFDVSRKERTGTSSSQINCLFFGGVEISQWFLLLKLLYVKGMPEVVFGQDKSWQQLLRIFKVLQPEVPLVMATRVCQSKFEQLAQHFPIVYSLFRNTDYR